MYEKKFAERLSQLRLKKGTSARDMSLSLGQNSGYINHIENGQTLPSLSVFFNICDYFSITPKDFFALDNNDPQLIKEITQDLYKLDEIELRSLYILIRALAEKKK